MWTKAPIIRILDANDSTSVSFVNILGNIGENANKNTKMHAIQVTKKQGGLAEQSSYILN